MSGHFGCSINDENAQMLTYYGMYALQHRGEYGCGLASNFNGYIDYKKGHGLVTNVLTEGDLKLLRGETAMGWISSSQKDLSNYELNPKVLGYRDGAMALSFDGYLLNYDDLKRQVDEKGFDYENVSHTEIIGQLINIHYNGNMKEALIKTLEQIHGAYSLILMTGDEFFGIRDRYGIKSLNLGSKDGGYIFASETCAIDSVGGAFIRPLDPGELLIIDNQKHQLKSTQLFPSLSRKACVFEPIYTARPDSILKGKSIYAMRWDAGYAMGAEEEVEADVVIGAPDSGLVYAIGFADSSKIPYGMGIVKNRYIGRTFIDKEASRRVDQVRIKHNALADVIKDKDVIVVDDSIVRGTTMKKTVTMLREAGAKSVHVRICSPMVFSGCKIGVSQAVSGKMLAEDHDLDEIREIIGADTLKYIRVDQMLEAFGQPAGFCTGCLNGKYPENLEV